MFSTGVIFLDFAIFYLLGVVTTYLLIKNSMKSGDSVERFGYWFIIFGSWVTLCFFVIIYLLGFSIGFFKQLWAEILKE